MQHPTRLTAFFSAFPRIPSDVIPRSFETVFQARCYPLPETDTNGLLAVYPEDDPLTVLLQPRPPSSFPPSSSSSSSSKLAMEEERLRPLRSFALDNPPPPDPPPQPLVPLHSLVLHAPHPPPPPLLPLPPSRVFCEHLVARALGEPTLVEVPFQPRHKLDKEEALDRKRKALPTPAAFFSCNLCLEVAVEPVITPCGHLFCWPCLFYAVRSAGGCCFGPCAACGSAVEIGAEGNVVPIYGRGAEEGVRRAWAGLAPARPRARRTEGARGRRVPVVEWLLNAEWSDTVRRRIGEMLDDVRRFGGGLQAVREGLQVVQDGSVFAEEVLADEGMEGNAGGSELDGRGERVQVRRRRLF